MTSHEPRNPFRDQYLAHLQRGPRHPIPRRIYVFGVLMLALLGLLLWIQLSGDGGIPTAQPAERTTRAPAPIDPEALAEMRAQRRARLAADPNSPYTDAENGSEFAETPGYRKLMSSFLDHAPASASNDPPPFLDYQLALSAPELLQGERVRARGLMIDVWPLRLQQPLWERSDVFRGFLAAADGTDWVAFDVLEFPHGAARVHDAVELEGVFYRTVSYEAKNGEKRTVPYLLARKLTVLDSATTPSSFLRGNSGVFLWVLGAGVLWFAFRIVQILRRRQRSAAAPQPGSAGFREMFDRRLKAPDDSATKGVAHDQKL
jgi:hypothetical protein